MAPNNLWTSSQEKLIYERKYAKLCALILLILREMLEDKITNLDVKHMSKGICNIFKMNNLEHKRKIWKDKFLLEMSFNSSK